jgi:hypothetical protein
MADGRVCWLLSGIKCTKRRSSAGRRRRLDKRVLFVPDRFKLFKMPIEESSIHSWRCISNTKNHNRHGTRQETLSGRISEGFLLRVWLYEILPGQISNLQLSRWRQNPGTPAHLSSGQGIFVNLKIFYHLRCQVKANKLIAPMPRRARVDGSGTAYCANAVYC